MRVVAAVCVASVLGLAATALPAAGADPWEGAARGAARAVEAARATGDPAALATALAQRAEAYQNLGHRQQALADLEDAARLVDGDAFPPGLRAGIAGALGQAYFLAGRADLAAPALARALGLARAAGSARLEAAVQNDRGLLLAAEGDRAGALAAYADAARLARAAGDGLLQAQAHLNAARLQLREERRGEAAGNAREALAAMATLSDSRERAFHTAAAGDVLRRSAGTDATRLLAAAEALDASAAMAARLDDPRAAAYAAGYRAELAIDQGRFDEATRHNQRAVFAAQQSGAPETLFLWQWQSARLLDRAGKADAAVEAYHGALDALARVKVDYAAELWAGRQSFRAEVGDAYFGLTDLLLRRAASAPDAQARRAGLREAQAVLERFKTVELEDYFRDDCVARYLARARSIEHTAPRTAVVYPVPLPDRLDLVVTIGEDIHQVTVPVGEERLRSEAQALRRLLEKRTTYQYLPHARQLHDWLIRPIEPLLAAANVDTLVVVPEQPLRSIPMAALHDGRDFVIARYAVAIAPSLTLVEPRPLALDKSAVLAGGLTEAVQGFPALPFVDIELDELRALGTREVLRDRSFTTEALERELKTKPFDVVHVASHAQFEADSRRSFLLTFDGRMTLDRLEETLKVNRFRDEPVELLFLSACQTAAGDERAALGLAGVAVKAGARSALASLWHINDQASSALVAEFYRQLAKPGVSKAEALRRAQREMLNDLRYRHPGYWSPFLLIGNWL